MDVVEALVDGTGKETQALHPEIRQTAIIAMLYCRNDGMLL